MFGFVSVTASVHSPLLDELDVRDRDALVARLRPRRYKRGQVVFNDGDFGECLYFVQSGRLDMQVTTTDGRAMTLRVIQPGEFFGELALVHPDRLRVGRVCALEPAELLLLHRHDFEELRQSHPRIDRFLVVALAERVIRTSKLVVEMLHRPEDRVWRSISTLAGAYQSEAIRMSQDDLAHAAGTVRQTVNRVLQEGVRRHILVLERGLIQVLDRDAVDAMARH
ncbi:MAG: family transcriptional regulator, cyclic receptor protein [Ilumatobacteraceae bacterium]